MLRGAIIGLGNVALDGHLPGWSARDGVEIVAVTDVQRERQADALARMPGARWFDSAEALLEHPGLDFVDICTPPSSHAPLIERALTRGLHVLCEKPLVRSPPSSTWSAGWPPSAAGSCTRSTTGTTRRSCGGRPSSSGTTPSARCDG